MIDYVSCFMDFILPYITLIQLRDLIILNRNPRAYDIRDDGPYHHGVLILHLFKIREAEFTNSSLFN